MQDLFKNDRTFVLTKESANEQVKDYFNIIHRLWESGERFPINLDDVWPTVYGRKQEAVRALVHDFIEGVDYQVLRRNAQQDFDEDGWGGQNRVTYMLSLSCFEFFLARKVRTIFDVYREFFHNAVDKIKRGELTRQAPTFQVPQTYADALRQLADTVERNERMALELKKQDDVVAAQTAKIADDAPKVAYYEATLQAKETYTFTQVAKELNYRSERVFTKSLLDHKIIYRQSGMYMLYSEYAGLGLTCTKTHNYFDKDGNVHTKTYTVWTEEGREYLHYLRDKGKI